MAGQPAPAGDIAVVPAGHPEPGAGGAQQPDVRDRPVVGVDDDEVVLAVPVQVGDQELVVPGEAAPARDVPVVPGDQPQAVVAVGDEQTQVRDCPVDSVEDGDLVDAVAVEVADVDLVVRLELPRAGHPLNSAEPVRQSGSVGLEQLDGRPVVQQQVAAAAAVEAPGMGVAKVVAGLAVPGGLDGRVADRTVRGRVPFHPAVLDRPVDPGVVGAAALI